ncbi:MAG: shikimate dehydrogenase [Xanthomonadales bacterium]|nr:shikimate dehydrogenase [Xanthomonadales bacterium]
MDQGRKLIRLALFGQPIKASLSPKIHRLFASQFDLDIEFHRIETAADGFSDALESFRLAGGYGCNVTLPIKRDAWQLAVESSAEVTQAQAANTLVSQPGGGWFAHNTDGPGLVVDLTSNHNIKLAGERILVLGAGGATAGILGSLLAAGINQIVLVNRNLERARELADRFGATAQISVIDWGSLPLQASFGLVINATSLGHQGKAPPLPASVFADGSVCYDLNYFKAALALENLCSEMGQKYIDGLGMLVEQAARSFYIWTGLKPETQSVIKACRVDIHVHHSQ